MTTYRATRDINLREGPHRDHPSITVLLEGTRVERLDGNGWFYVRADVEGRRVGWVNGDNLEEVADGDGEGRELSNLRFNKARRQQYVESIMSEVGGGPNDFFNLLRDSDQAWDSGRWLHGFTDGGSHFSVAADWNTWRNEGRLEVVEPTRAISRQEYVARFGLVGKFTYCNFNISYCYRQAYGGTNLQSPRGAAGPEMSANALHEFFSDHWKEVGPGDAARISNAGGFVIASWRNPSGHGHVVFLLDDSPETGSLADLRCFHVGAGLPHPTTVGGAFGTRAGIKLFVDPETHREWLRLRGQTPAHSEAPSSPFSIDSNLKTRPYAVTAAALDDYLREKDSPLAGIGQGVLDGARKHEINAVYILAHAIHESGWGRSRIYREKNNLFGWGAIDSSPYARAGKFPSPEVCIDYVMGKINSLYLRPTGRYYVGRPCLGNKEYGMNFYYASDREWGSKIAAIARRIEEATS